MEWSARIGDWLTRLVSETSSYAPLVLFAASAAEYLLPFLPGDTLVLLGAWYAVKGALSWPVTYLAVTSGAVVGAMINYAIGQWLGARLDHVLARRGGLTAARIATFEAQYRKRGRLLLVINRFLPGFRAFIFVGAGAAGIPLRQVVIYGTISAALWNACLLGAGAFLAESWDELGGLLARYTAVVSAVIVAIGIVWLTRAYLRRRRR